MLEGATIKNLMQTADASQDQSTAWQVQRQEKSCPLKTFSYAPFQARLEDLEFA